MRWFSTKDLCLTFFWSNFERFHLESFLVINVKGIFLFTQEVWTFLKSMPFFSQEQFIKMWGLMPKYLQAYHTFKSQTLMGPNKQKFHHTSSLHLPLVLLRILSYLTLGLHLSLKYFQVLYYDVQHSSKCEGKTNHLKFAWIK